MSIEKSGKEVLKNLCCNNGWSYGVFWSSNQQNSLLLTLEDAYHEDQMGVMIDDMLLQVHMLGEGVIGRAAFTKKHEYLFSDIHNRKQTPEGSGEDYKGDSEFYGQFSFGIKTIAVIPVEPLGVVQFGSFQKLPERLEFVDQTKDLFRWVKNREGLLLMENTFSSSNSEIFGPSGLFASLISGENSEFANSGYSYGASKEDLMEATYSLTNLIQPFSSNSNQQMINPIEAQVDFDGYVSNIQPQQSFLESGSYLDYTISGAPCSCTWRGRDSALTSCMQHLQCQIRAHCSQDLFSIKPNSSTSCSDTTKTTQESSDSQFCSGNSLRHWDSTLMPYSGESKHQGLTSLCTFEEFFQENDIAITLSKSCPVNNFTQLLSPMPDQSNDLMDTAINYNLQHETGFTSVLPNFNGQNHPCTSTQSSITNVFSCVEKEKCMCVSGSDKFFDCFKADRGREKSGNWDNNIIPAVGGGHLNFSTNKSKCISGTSKKLFSSSEINHLMDDITSSSSSVARSSLADQLSSATKRRKIETSLHSSDQVKFTGLSNMISVHLLYNLDRTDNPGPKSDAIHKLESGSLIGDSYSINASNSESQFKRHEQPAKTLKKKAKPGTRPRPKDRQQIHDHLLELRELIPNGEKMSIDSLLHRTIKHLFFLQSVTEHAERLKQIGESKDVTVSKDTTSSGDCGVTWACEVGDKTMVCPLIVEDLSTPGEMFIEIQCDEQGSFLEIVDIIRGFGLTILKGVMEACEAKICGRFIVAAEGNRNVTRHEIFSSLVQLLQFTGSNGVNIDDQLGNFVSGGPALFNTCQKSDVPLPVSVAETLQCASL